MSPSLSKASKAMRTKFALAQQVLRLQPTDRAAHGCRRRRRCRTPASTNCRACRRRAARRQRRPPFPQPGVQSSTPVGVERHAVRARRAAGSAGRCRRDRSPGPRSGTACRPAAAVTGALWISGAEFGIRQRVDAGTEVGALAGRVVQRDRLQHRRLAGLQTCRRCPRDRSARVRRSTTNRPARCRRNAPGRAPASAAPQLEVADVGRRGRRTRRCRSGGRNASPRNRSGRTARSR